MAASANPRLAFDRSTASTGIAPASTMSGMRLCGDKAPQNALAMAARQGRAVSHSAIARCMALFAARGKLVNQSVLIGVRQQREETRALHGGRELALIV